MSAKTEKKIKQLYRRDIRDKVKEMADQHFKDGPVFNKRPKYCPLWFWNWCASFVCDIDFLIRYQIYLKNNPVREARELTVEETQEILNG